MLYSSDDTHNKNRNATLATPRQASTKLGKIASQGWKKFFPN